MQASSGRSDTLNAILKATKKGGPLASAGVRGRLGDLGSIPGEYDVAVSTACGFLDHIVVNTVQGGQQCLDFLRQTNGGRASFICLDQMSEWATKMDRPISCPAPRLFDLVIPSDPGFKPAFYMALKDTLVCPDLDSAVKIAYEGDRAKWRVVALDGNLIDTSGAMSGGGKTARSGSMRVHTGSSTVGHSSVSGSSRAVVSSEVEVTPQIVAKLEKTVTDLQSELTDCRAARAKAEQVTRNCTSKTCYFVYQRNCFYHLMTAIKISFF